jgi:hypothetical protein
MVAPQLHCAPRPPPAGAPAIKADRRAWRCVDRYARVFDPRDQWHGDSTRRGKPAKTDVRRRAERVLMHWLLGIVAHSEISCHRRRRRAWRYNIACRANSVFAPCGSRGHPVFTLRVLRSFSPNELGVHRASQSLAAGLETWREQRVFAAAASTAAAAEAEKGGALDAAARSDVAGYEAAQKARARESLAAGLGAWRAGRRADAAGAAAAAGAERKVGAVLAPSALPASSRAFLFHAAYKQSSM